MAALNGLFKLWQNIYNIKFAIFNILSVKFRGINYIRNVVQPSSVFISKIIRKFPLYFTEYIKSFKL